jgi:hypothetical protein
VVMVSGKPVGACRVPPQASRVVVRARAAVAVRRSLATEQRACGRRSRGRARSPDARRRERGAAVVGPAASTGREGKFSSLQALENTQDRVGIGIRPNPPPFGGCRCNGGDPLAEPERVATPPSSATFAAIGAECGEAKFSCPQSLEKVQNGEGISQAVAPPAGLSRRSGERCGFTISSAWTPGKRSPGTGKLPSV